MTSAPCIAFPIVDSIHEEAMAMLLEARAYCSGSLRRDIGSLDGFARLGVYGEAMRVTSRLAWITSWVAHQRAVRNGETEGTAGPAVEADLEHVSLDAAGVDRPGLPGALRSLLERTRSLFLRVLRIDPSLAATATS